MRLTALIWVVLLIAGCQQEKDVKRSHEVISAITKNEKAMHFEVILLSKQTDTLWISFWEKSIEGEWTGRNGERLDIADILNVDDLSYLRDQYKKTFLIDKSLLRHSVELVHPTIDFKDQVDYQYYKISTPAFTKDGMYCLVYWEDVCHMDCGGGGFYIYKKSENATWERFLTRYLWMS